jgi:signal transduction histidine kinase
VRRIAQDLRPPALDLDLSAAIEFEAAAISRRTGLRCRVSSLPQTCRLEQAQSIAAFRVFQEAMTNIARHADASAVRIHLREARGTFTMDVHDNGRGITKAQTTSPSAIGLLGMREAVQPHGGTISITGRKGRGTRVVVRFPLPRLRRSS